MVDKIKELQGQVKELKTKLQTTDDIKRRLETVERKLQLSQRTDPAIMLSTNLHDLGLVNERARVYRDGVQSIPKLTTTKIEFNSKTHESYDPRNNFDITTNYNYTVPVNGIYHITSEIGLDFLGADKVLTMVLYVNGSAITPTVEGRIITGIALREYHIRIADSLSLTLGDTVDARLYHTDGIALNTAGGCFTIHLISG